MWICTEIDAAFMTAPFGHGFVSELREQDGTDGALSTNGISSS